MKFSQLENIEIEGIDIKDYPDFCDAFIAYAEYNGEELTENEYNFANDNFSGEIYDYIFDNQLYL